MNSSLLTILAEIQFRYPKIKELEGRVACSVGSLQARPVFDHDVSESLAQKIYKCQALIDLIQNTPSGYDQSEDIDFVMNFITQSVWEEHPMERKHKNRTYFMTVGRTLMYIDSDSGAKLVLAGRAFSRSRFGELAQKIIG